MTDTREQKVKAGMEIFYGNEARIEEVEADLAKALCERDQARAQVTTLLFLNDRQEKKIVHLQTALNLQQTAKHAIKAAKETPAPLPPLDTLTADIAKRLAPPLRDMQMPRDVADRRWKVA